MQGRGKLDDRRGGLARFLRLRLSTGWWSFGAYLRRTFLDRQVRLLLLGNEQRLRLWCLGLNGGGGNG